MGATKSKQTDIHSTGPINNNVVINDHIQITNKEAMALIYILIALKVVEILYVLYRDHRRAIQKKAKKTSNNGTA